MHKPIFVVILICLCSITPLTIGQNDITTDITEQTGSVTGYIYDSETLEPLEATSVMLLETMEVVYTTVDGIFTFEDIAPGEYTAMAEAENYREEEQTVSVTVGQPVELEFYLKLQLSFWQKFFRILKSPPMLEFYAYAGIFLIIWLFATILGRLLKPENLDLSTNYAWLTMIIVHIVLGVVFIVHLLLTSLRGETWYYIPAWLLPYLAFMIADIILIAFLIKQRRDLKV